MGGDRFELQRQGGFCVGNFVDCVGTEEIESSRDVDYWWREGVLKIKKEREGLK